MKAPLLAYVVGFIGTKAFLKGVSEYKGIEEGKIVPDDFGLSLKKEAEMRGYSPVLVLDRPGFIALQKKHKTLASVI